MCRAQGITVRVPCERLSMRTKCQLPLPLRLHVSPYGDLQDVVRDRARPRNSLASIWQTCGERTDSYTKYDTRATHVLPTCNKRALLTTFFPLQIKAENGRRVCCSCSKSSAAFSDWMDRSKNGLCFLKFWIGPIFSVWQPFSHKYLHHTVPCGIVYHIKVIIFNSIFF